MLSTVPRARCCDVVPVRELPYGPAAMLHQEAGQMAASDYMHPSQKPLASLGASTDGEQTSSFAPFNRQSLWVDLF